MTSLKDASPAVSMDMADRASAENYLKTVMNTIIDGLIVIDAAGIIKNVNSACERLFGYSAPEMLGRNVKMLMPEPYHSEHDGYLSNYLETGSAKVIGIGREVTARRKDGSIFPMELGINEMQTGGGRMFVGTIRDISERKLAQEALKKSEERYHLAIQGLSVGIWDWNPNTHELYWSRRFRDIIGISDDEPLDDIYEVWESRLHPEDRERTLEMLFGHLKNRTAYDVEYRLRREGGSYAWIHAKGQAVWDEEGAALRMVGSIEDISARKLSEQQLQQALTELKLTNEDLETFTYIASHDLRSPLVNLKGFSCELHRSIDVIIPMLERILPQLSEMEQEILHRELCRMMPRALQYIISSVEKMDRLTSAILKLSRLGRTVSASEQIATQRLVQDCLAALAHQIETTRTQVEVGALPDIVGDKTCIEQVFGNLLDNALKYLDRARPGNIRIHASQSLSHTIFSVQDNGRGIAKDDLHKVFEIFRRAGDVESIPGEGMGMAYVRAIIKRHGGDIWCESMPGEGTTFHFTIPRQELSSKAA